jgi:hypothetical protein
MNGYYTIKLKVYLCSSKVLTACFAVAEEKEEFREGFKICVLYLFTEKSHFS